MGMDQVALVLLGALAGGFVNGLTGFGTGLTAMGLWLYALSPPVAASLVIICSVISQLQTLPAIWRSIQWKGVLPYVAPGLFGVPIGTRLLPYIDPRMFKIGVGLFLVSYSAYALIRRQQVINRFGGRIGDCLVGFGGGCLGGLTGISGVPVLVWTDIRGYAKEHRRSLLQAFNITILTMSLASHAFTGLLTAEVARATLAALPGTVGGAWLGLTVYRQLGNRGFQQIVMGLLLASGLVLIATSW